VTIADTDVLIDFLNGRAPASIDDRLARGTLSTTAVNAYELRRGARNERALRSVELLLAQLAEIVPFDDAAAGEAAAAYRELSRAGRVIGRADLYIAGICLATGATLLTRNVREYERIPGLDMAAP
jgi:tRNA(fMet)-specific endonuclease VapC